MLWRDYNPPMTAYITLAILLGVAAHPVAQTHPRAKVYCFAKPSSSGTVDVKSIERSESMKDVKEALAKKNDWIEVVDAAPKADIRLEIVERTEKRVGSTTTGSGANARTRVLNEYTLKTVMRAGRYENELTGIVPGDYVGATWPTAADQIANQVEKWVAANFAVPVASAPIPAPARRGAAAATGPRDVALAWLTAPTVAAAREQLLTITVDQAREFERTANADRATVVKFVNFALAPGAALRDNGVTLTVKDYTVSASGGPGEPPSEMVFESDGIAGDRAVVPLRIMSGGEVSRGSIELKRENAAWRVAAADIGEGMRFPRFDSARLVPELAAMAERQAAQRRSEGLRAQAIGALRSLVTAENAFASRNGGFYGPLDCLTTNACFAAGAVTPAPILNAAPSVSGFTGTFHPGAAPAATIVHKTRASTRSLASWAYTLTPNPDAPPGLASFCADATGTVCQLSRPSAPVTGGLCPATCTGIR